MATNMASILIFVGERLYEDSSRSPTYILLMSGCHVIKKHVGNHGVHPVRLFRNVNYATKMAEQESVKFLQATDEVWGQPDRDLAMHEALKFMGELPETFFLMAGFYPRCSMYGIFTYIYHKFKPNVGKYSIDGAYRYAYCWCVFIG